MANAHAADSNEDGKIPSKGSTNAMIFKTEKDSDWKLKEWTMHPQELFKKKKEDTVI